MLQAIGKHVIVKAVYEEKKGNQPLILTTKEPLPTHYEVMSVGEDVDSIQKGDKIPYPQYTNPLAEHEGEKLFVLSLENITAIIC